MSTPSGSKVLDAVRNLDFLDEDGPSLAMIALAQLSDDDRQRARRHRQKLLL